MPSQFSSAISVCNSGSTHHSMRHAERFGQRRNSSVAQVVVLSAWRVVHGTRVLGL
jgi:hypothetical protein